MTLYRAFKALADSPGLSAAERAQADRTAAAAREFEVARLELDIAAHECTGALNDFMATWEALDLRNKIDEAEEVATHPDLAELNVQMDGYYGPSTTP